MRKNFGPKTWLYPMPVLMVGTYDSDGVPDIMTAAWGGIFNSEKIQICIDKSHKTAKNLAENPYMTVSIADASHIAQCDFAGLVSANEDPEKIRKTGFHIRKSDFVNAPVFEDLPFTLECRLIEYNPDTECALGEIVNVSADDSILDDSGNISLDKFEPVCYDPVTHLYRKIGNPAGHAFQDGKILK